MQVSEWTQLAATAFAAVASACAAVNTISARRSAQEGRRPELVAQPLTVGQEIHFDIFNAGEGLALTCGFMIVYGDDHAFGYLGYGTLRPGEHARLRTLLNPAGAKPGEIFGALVCRDVRGDVWGWDMHGSPKRRLNQQGDHARMVSMVDAYRAIYPNVDWKEGRAVSWDVWTEREVAEGRGSGSLRLDRLAHA